MGTGRTDTAATCGNHLVRCGCLPKTCRRSIQCRDVFPVSQIGSRKGKERRSAKSKDTLLQLNCFPVCVLPLDLDAPNNLSSVVCSFSSLLFPLFSQSLVIFQSAFVL